MEDVVLDPKEEIRASDNAPQEPIVPEPVPVFGEEKPPEPFCVVEPVPAGVPSEVQDDSQGDVPADSADNFSVDAGVPEPLSERDLTLHGTIRKNKGIVSHKAGAGRPTALDDEAFLLIRKVVMGGGGLQEIAGAMQVSVDTVYDWSYKNYKDFSEKVHGYEVERLVKQAERNAQDFLAMHPESSSDKVVKANMTTFVLETAGKKTYSKRTELTGSEGKDLGVVVLPSKDKIG